MILGYNTNGLAHHDPFQAVELLADIGYRSVAITLDHGPLNPLDKGFAGQLAKMRRLLDRLQMRSVVETGARYLLDPRAKHEPTLVSPDPAAQQRRVDFLSRAVDAARELASDCVSLWSGVVHDAADDATVWQRLETGLAQVLDYADSRQIPVGFEPEPGMFIDTMARYDDLCRRLGDDCLRLTLDVGHLHCQGEQPLADYIERYSGHLVNVHIEDMRAGVHEHLMFGEGEIDFGPVMRALAVARYGGGVHVELSRHSHVGPQAARRAFDFLSPFMAA
ncbi:MAG TPA: sugar phosphate isomerase/epimerase family protein [Pirellulales bacterium]|nr:sugar phosphate isomerase/epimerase family protein [Pirellulales bacterium]